MALKEHTSAFVSNSGYMSENNHLHRKEDCLATEFGIV